MIGEAHNRCMEMPIRQAFFSPRYAAFAGAARYSDWKFVFAPAEPEN